jgi:hypothetical protein
MVTVDDGVSLAKRSDIIPMSEYPVRYRIVKALFMRRFPPKGKGFVILALFLGTSNPYLIDHEYTSSR